MYIYIFIHISIISLSKYSTVTWATLEQCDCNCNASGFVNCGQSLGQFIASVTRATSYPSKRRDRGRGGASMIGVSPPDWAWLAA